MVYRLPPVRRCLVTAAEWLTYLITPGDGWPIAPLGVVACAVVAVALILAVLRWESRRLDREAHALSVEIARERDADRVVERYLDLGMTPDAVRRAAHGGPAWCAAVDRALARRGPTGTQVSAPARGGS